MKLLIMHVVSTQVNDYISGVASLQYTCQQVNNYVSGVASLQYTCQQSPVVVLNISLHDHPKGMYAFLLHIVA